MRQLNAELVGVCLVLTSLGSYSRAVAFGEPQIPTPLNWHTEMAAAVAESRETGKPILMEINGRPWCPPCNTQGDEIINHADFQSWAGENVVLLDVKVGKGYDKDQGSPIWREQMKKHNLLGIPAAVLLAPDGKSMGTVYPKDDVHQWLGAAKNIVSSHASKATRREQTKPTQAIPFRLTKWNNLSVPTTLNDSIALNMMFHTAVDSVSLTKATTDCFPEITLEQDADVESWGGSSKSRVGTGHSLKIADLQAQQVTVFEGLHSGHDTDGKFGPAQLSSSLLAIDFDQSEIRLLTELPSDLSQWQKLSFETARGAMFVTAAVHSGDKLVEHKFMIHSGYSGFALLDDSFTSSHPFLGKLEIIGESELKDSAGNKIKTRRVTLPRLQLGETVFENPPVSFFAGKLGGQQFSLLGGDFLKRLNLIFDFDSHTLYIKKSSLSDVEYFDAN